MTTNAPVPNATDDAPPPSDDSTMPVPTWAIILLALFLLLVVLLIIVSRIRKGRRDARVRAVSVSPAVAAAAQPGGGNSLGGAGNAKRPSGAGGAGARVVPGSPTRSTDGLTAVVPVDPVTPTAAADEPGTPVAKLLSFIRRHTTGGGGSRNGEAQQQQQPHRNGPVNPLARRVGSDVVVVVAAPGDDGTATATPLVEVSPLTASEGSNASFAQRKGQAVRGRQGVGGGGGFAGTEGGAPVSTTVTNTTATTASVVPLTLSTTNTGVSSPACGDTPHTATEPLSLCVSTTDSEAAVVIHGRQEQTTPAVAAVSAASASAFTLFVNSRVGEGDTLESVDPPVGSIVTRRHQHDIPPLNVDIPNDGQRSTGFQVAGGGGGGGGGGAAATALTEAHTPLSVSTEGGKSLRDLVEKRSLYSTTLRSNDFKPDAEAKDDALLTTQEARRLSEFRPLGDTDGVNDEAADDALNASTLGGMGRMGGMNGGVVDILAASTMGPPTTAEAEHHEKLVVSVVSSGMESAALGYGTTHGGFSETQRTAFTTGTAVRVTSGASPGGRAPVPRSRHMFSHEVQRVLGNGAYATVTLVRLKNVPAQQRFGTELMALKTIERPTEHDMRVADSQLAVLRRINHCNVIRHFEVFADLPRKRLAIFMEYVDGGTLAERARKGAKGGPVLAEKEVARFIAQVLHGAQALHEVGVLHRDIKGENVLISSTGLCKLADFGNALWTNRDGLEHTQVSPDGTPVDFVGTPNWMAPEVFAYESHTGTLRETIRSLSATPVWPSDGPEPGPPSDVWSIGCTLSEALNLGVPPWPKYANPWQALMNIHEAMQKAPTNLPTGTSEQAKSFILGCLTKDPLQRPTAEDLHRHPFLADVDYEPMRRDSACSEFNVTGLTRSSE